MPKALMLAFTSPVSDEAGDEFNDWYSNKHVFDLLDIEGFVSATRYELPKGIETLPGVPDGVSQRYMALYEIEGETEEDLQRFADALKVALSDGTADIHPKLDMENLAASFCLPIGERIDHSSPKPDARAEA
jgi:hypothetical protein